MSAVPTSLGHAFASAHDANVCMEMNTCTMGGHTGAQEHGLWQGKNAQACHALEFACAHHTPCVAFSYDTETCPGRPFLFAAQSLSLKPFPHCPLHENPAYSSPLIKSHTHDRCFRSAAGKPNVTCQVVIRLFHLNSRTLQTGPEGLTRARHTAPRLT